MLQRYNLDLVYLAKCRQITRPGLIRKSPRLAEKPSKPEPVTIVSHRTAHYFFLYLCLRYSAN